MSYFAPTYFGPAYFGGLDGLPVGSVEPTTGGGYFAPSFFAPCYFAGLGGLVPPPGPPCTLPTTLDAVAIGVRDLVLAAGVGVGPAVFFSHRLVPDPILGGPQVVIARGGFSVVDDLHTGAGSAGAVFRGEVRVAVWSLGALDRRGQDQIHLLGALAPPPALVSPWGSIPGVGLRLGTSGLAPGTPGSPPLGASTPEGLEALSHRVRAAVDLQFVVTPAGDHLTVLPLRVLRSSEPITAPQFEGWAGVQLILEARYLAAV